ncbi:MAG: hypothetical protein RL318_1206 [Fibrobacterota bacterium]
MLDIRRIALLGALLSGAVLACLWDDESVAVEQEPFPSEPELLAGKFTRHSQAFWQWKAADRFAKLEAGKGDAFALRDDLAVSLDKLGLNDSAIATMRISHAKDPSRYETLANLGTFLFHGGKLSEGLPFIDSALRVNPDAHFGRERYQRWLVEYALSKGGVASLPLDTSKEGKGERGYARFVATKLGAKALSDEARAKAVTGVLGMMRFGDHRSPVLLEAYADLVRKRDRTGRAMAVMAYLKAAKMSGKTVAERYRLLAVDCSESASALRTSEANLDRLLAEGDDHFASITWFEASWIAKGVDVDSAYREQFFRKRQRRPSTGF